MIGVQRSCAQFAQGCLVISLLELVLRYKRRQANLPSSDMESSLATPDQIHTAYRLLYDAKVVTEDWYVLNSDKALQVLCAWLDVPLIYRCSVRTPFYIVKWMRGTGTHFGVGAMVDGTEHFMDPLGDSLTRTKGQLIERRYYGF